MAWSYTGNPADSDKDAVRFLIGDTDTNNQQVSDEEILFMLDQFSSTYGAAVALAESLAGKYALWVDESVGDVSASYGQLAENFRLLARRLRAVLYRSGIANPRSPYGANKESVFTVGQFDSSKGANLDGRDLDDEPGNGKGFGSS